MSVVSAGAYPLDVFTEQLFFGSFKSRLLLWSETRGLQSGTAL